LAFLCTLLLLQVGISVNAEGQQLLHGTVPADIERLGLKPISRLDSAHHLHLAIGLPLRNKAGFTKFLEELYDPASPNYHNYLTSDQFDTQFRPTDQDYQTLITFAKENGLTISSTSSNNIILNLDGTVADIERAFHVSMRVYQHPTQTRTFYAPDKEPSLNLEVSILSISGLNNFYKTLPNIKTSRVLNEQNEVQNTGSGPDPDHGYMGNDFRKAYALNVLLDGSGQTVGIVAFDGYKIEDIRHYEDLSYPSLPYVTVLPETFDNFDGNPHYANSQNEVTADIEMAIAMAPKLSKVIVYEGQPSDDLSPQAWENILNQIASENLAKQISCSWSLNAGPVDPLAEQSFQIMASHGQSFFCASGDNCAYRSDAQISFPEDSPNITQVGGTILTTTGPGGSYVSETAWNDGPPYGDYDGRGSGGGISVQYAIPSWQQGMNMSANYGSVIKRNVPDVALTSKNIYIYSRGTDMNVWGTSLAAPLWAGFVALINQQLAADGEQTIGFINPAIYSIGKGGQYNYAFHDIISGDNIWSHSPFSQDYPAVSGYDLCTGLGTPVGQTTIDDLVLFALGVKNKSTYYWPTGYNNEHPLERSSDGKVHEVFSSGGEIFYRRSSNNGLTWDITALLSSGGANDAPSIVACSYPGSASQLEVVWQQQLDGTHYNICYAFSSNFGLTWTCPATPLCPNLTVSGTQSNAGYGQGPTPVISSYLVIQGAASYLVVFAEQNGLRYATSKNSQNSWSSSINYVPGTYGGSGIWHPSLVSYNTNPNNSKIFLIYADKYNGFYSQRYVSIPNSEQWDSNPLSIYNNNYSMSPSLAVDNSFNTYAAWSSFDGNLGKYTLWFWQGFSNGAWSTTWKHEFTTISENIFYPAITYYYYSGQPYPNRINIVAWGYTNDIWQIKWDGNGNWIGPTAFSLGYTAGSPNLTHEYQGTGTPFEVWTNESQSPYLIQIGSTGLPKVAATNPGPVLVQNPGTVSVQTSRAAEMFDKIDHSVLRVDVTVPVIATASGNSVSIPFKEYDYKQGVSVSSSSIFDYLRTDSVQIPSDAASLSFNVTVTIDLPDTLADGSLNQSTSSVFNGASLGLNIMAANTGTPVVNSQSFTSTIASRHTKISKVISLPLQSMQGKTMAFQPFGKLAGSFNESDLGLSLINVFGSTAGSAGETAQSSSSATLPVNVTLGQNFPNPFNPATTIAYRVTQAGRLSLKIYDVLGRVVATLVNSDQNEGVYTQHFDASHLSSGVYFYQLIAPGVNETRKMLVTK
jgi:Pro-kumamolisin, activation domain/Secretion system C-terminal sorting domain/Subtilase family